MNKHVNVITVTITIFALMIAIMSPSVNVNAINSYHKWDRFKSLSCTESYSKIEFSWTLPEPNEVTAVEVIGIDRDGSEHLLASLNPSITTYTLTEKVSTYRKVRIVYYRTEGTEKTYAIPWELENSFFEEYLLQDGISGIQHHSQEEIKKMWTTLSPCNMKNKYDVKPKNKIPYAKGKVAASTLKNGINTLNFIRYVAGIPSNVSIKDSYQSLAQAAALVNYNDKTSAISHSPHKPRGMNKSLYEEGYEGASSSNLAAGDSDLYDAIVTGWMSDSDPSNIAEVGHRRWCLNPSMLYTGYGIDEDTYAMYSFDESRNDTGYNSVCWPAENMPLNLFANYDAWSIFVRIPVPKKGTKVVLTRKRDKKQWSFNSESKKFNGNYMSIQDDGYGSLRGCIIFRPKNIKYKNGDSFLVEVSGEDFSFSYNVNFFSLKSTVKKNIKMLKLVKYKKGTKLIKGMSIGEGKVKVRIASKQYTVNAKKNGLFTIKLAKKLKRKQKIRVQVSKKNHQTKEKIFRVK